MRDVPEVGPAGARLIEQMEDGPMARILVVDDEEQVRSLLREILESEGHAVGEAANGAEAMFLARTAAWDLVIIDIIMPVKEGLETTLELRREFPALKIVAISGGGRLAPQGYLDTAEVVGADRTLMKPIPRENLLAVVTDLLVG